MYPYLVHSSVLSLPDMPFSVLLAVRWKVVLRGCSFCFQGHGGGDARELFLPMEFPVYPDAQILSPPAGIFRFLFESLRRKPRSPGPFMPVWMEGDCLGVVTLETLLLRVKTPSSTPPTHCPWLLRFRPRRGFPNPGQQGEWAPANFSARGL